jgi:hypothetical protein
VVDQLTKKLLGLARRCVKARPVGRFCVLVKRTLLPTSCLPSGQRSPILCLDEARLTSPDPPEIGTIHYSRFTILDEKTLLFLGDFDGEFSRSMADLAGHARPVNAWLS